MALQQKIEDIKVLAKILRDGWDRRTVFNVPLEVLEEAIDDEDFYETLEIESRKFALNDGWKTVIQELGNLLEVKTFDDSADFIEISPDRLYVMIEEADAFLELVK